MPTHESVHKNQNTALAYIQELEVILIEIEGDA